MEVSKGGTGITSFLANQILYTYDDDGTVKMGQNQRFLSDLTNNRLIIGQPTIPGTFASGIITTGNLLIESGGLILRDHGGDPNNYTFVKYNALDEAIQFSHKQPLTYTDSNMAIKTAKLMSHTSMTIGDGTQQANSVDLNTGLRLGSTYRSNNTSPPSNGLIVEDSIQIGGISTNIINSDTNLLGYRLLADMGNIYATASNTGIVSDITGELTHLTPIHAQRRSINAEAPIGISVPVTCASASNCWPLRVTMNSLEDAATGMISSMTNDGTTTAHAVNIALDGAAITTMNGLLSFQNHTFSAGVYGKQPSTTSTNDYSGYFGGDFLAASLTDQDDTPIHSLTVDSIYIEGPLSLSHQTGIINAIDWTNGLIVNIDVDDNNRQIVFSTPPYDSSKLLVIVHHTGSGKITWMDSNIQWHDGYAPELTTSAGAKDIIIFIYEDGNYYGSAAYNFKIPDTSPDP